MCNPYCEKYFIHFLKPQTNTFPRPYVWCSAYSCDSSSEILQFLSVKWHIFYFVTPASHLFYYRLHREAITVPSCQSSRTIWMTLLLYDLVLGDLVRNRELDFTILRDAVQLEIFYDSMSYLTEVLYVRQWEGLVWTSAMLLRNWTFKLLTNILKGNLSNQESIFFKWRIPSHWGLINYWGSTSFFV